MKLWTALMAFLIGTTVWAQDEMKPDQEKESKPPAEHKPAETKPQEDPYKWVEGAVKRLAERVGLTEEQVSKVTEKIKAKLTEISKLREDAGKELKDLLGEDTYNKIRRDLTNMLNGQGGRGPGGPGGQQNMAKRMWDRMKEELSLSDEQVKKIEPAVEEYGKKVRDLFEEARGQGREGMQAMGEKMRAELETFTAKVKENLNDDQKAKLDELIKNMRNFGGRRGNGQGGGGNRDRNRGGGDEEKKGGDEKKEN
jgi:ribosomal protein S13